MKGLADRKNQLGNVEEFTSLGSTTLSLYNEDRNTHLIGLLGGLSSYYM